MTKTKTTITALELNRRPGAALALAAKRQVVVTIKGVPVATLVPTRPDGSLKLKGRKADG